MFNILLVSFILKFIPLTKKFKILLYTFIVTCEVDNLSNTEFILVLNLFGDLYAITILAYDKPYILAQSWLVISTHLRHEKK